MYLNDFKNDLEKLQDENNIVTNTIDWIKSSVENILDRNFLNSINYIIWIKLLNNKFESWNSNWFNTLLYEILTTRPEFLKEKYLEDNPNFLLNLQKKFEIQSIYYKQVLIEIEKQSRKDWILDCTDNPAWFSLKTKNYSNNQSWVNYKLYLTIPIKWYDYISKVYNLWLLLNNLSISSLDKISLKVPKSFLWFLSHSDSLVIHFKNIDNKITLETILKNWMINNWITEEKRNLWRVKFAIDSVDDSFTGLISKNIEKWILDNIWKYDNKLISKLAIEYLIKHSQDFR